jgi:flagellar basal-body rod modification protein FlgD
VGLTTSSDMFLKLLTTQLKAQDPISPMNPNEFVGQLVQFNTLGQIMEIRGVLEQIQQAATAATSSQGEK